MPTQARGDAAIRLIACDMDGTLLDSQKRLPRDFAAVFEALRALANGSGIAWQTKHRVAGGTDAGRIHLTRAGVKTAALAVPVRYIHSPCCVAAMEDIDGMLALSRRFLEYMGEDHHEF